MMWVCLAQLPTAYGVASAVSDQAATARLITILWNQLSGILWKVRDSNPRC